MKKMLLLVLVLLGASAAGCGGKTNGAMDSASPGNLAAETGLPSIGSLELAVHGASIIGPGWVEFQPTDISHNIASSGTTALPGGELTVDGSSGMAWAVFGVAGFESDCFPTSLRVAAHNVAGPYYVGFANYRTASWKFSGQFNASAEITYPTTDDSFTNRDYVSPRDVVYFAIIAPEGNTLDLVSLALGIHGGDDPPLPVHRFLGRGGENGLSMTWKHSGSVLDADFAGYYLERAPFMSGGFTRINNEPILVDHYLDDTVVLGEYYRYRIAAVDTSGNLSLWYGRGFAAQAGNLADPVAVLNMPEGPLYGPVEVTFDMSGSYDPEGGAIDNYRLFSDYGEPDISGPDSTVTMVLQPGCYEVSCLVSVGPRRGQTYQMLKVYPEWQEEPVVVRDSVPGFGRALQYRAAQNPVTGDAVYFCYDLLIPAAAAWIPGAGGEFELLTLPTKETGIYFIGEPVVVGNAILVPFNIDGAIQVARLENGVFEWVIADLAYGASGAVALAVDGDGHVWILFNREVGGIINLYLRQLFGTEPDVTIAIDMGVDRIFDCEWNAAAAAIDIAYGHTMGTAFGRYVPATGTTTGTLVSPITADWVDLEINPATGRPAILYRHSFRQQFSEQNPDETTWSAEVAVDNSADNSFQAELVAANGQLYATFGRDALATRLYEYVGGVWSSIGDVDYGGVFGIGTNSLCPLTPTSFAFSDIDALGSTHMGVLDTSATYSDSIVLNAVMGQQQWLHAAVGDPGFHVIFGNGSTLQHSTSPDGVAWTDQPGMGVVDKPNITGIESGGVVRSYVGGGTAYLDEWSGGAWVNYRSQTIGTDCAPVLSEQPNYNGYVWAMMDNVLPATFHIYYQVIFPSHLTPSISTTPIWAGTYVYGVSRNPGFLVVAEGADPGEGDVGFLPYEGGSVGRLFSPISGYYGNSRTESKELSCSSYNLRGYTTRLPVYWASYGPGFSPVRITKDQNEIISVTELPGMPDAYNIDIKRSVSSASTWGGGAVALVASNDNKLSWFEWDNFGNWENLELPAGMDYAHNHEIVVGADGRWYIVYHNFVTDQILCWSTI